MYFFLKLIMFCLETLCCPNLNFFFRPVGEISLEAWLDEAGRRVQSAAAPPRARVQKNSSPYSFHTVHVDNRTVAAVTIR